jgi:L-rhamnose mutarotase
MKLNTIIRDFDMRRAFKMQLKPGNVDEYRQRHDDIWPELSVLLTGHGISNYTIFLDETTLSLFAVMDVEDPAKLEPLPNHPVMKKWWDYMEPLMECEASNKPREWPLAEVFHHA